MVQHYYSEKQDSPLRPTLFSATLRGLPFEFRSGSGVFSKDHIDSGTRLLCESAPAKSGMRILDLGCGYGPVGISIAKTVPDTNIVMTDVNERAVGLSKKNCKQNSVRNATVVQGNLYDKVEGIFDMILTNPPQNAGKDICQAMMDQAVDFLKPGGQFVFVARHQKGGKSLSKHLEEVFGNVEVLDRKSGFRVYKAVKNQ